MRARTVPPIDEPTFHRWLARRLRGAPGGLLPVGDDVAALPLSGRRVALLTTDALSEGTHFKRESDPEAIGRAAAAVSLSDLASKGGEPVAGLLDLLVPPGTPARWAEGVVRGAEAMGRRYGAPLVGGDTKPARGRSVVGTYLGFGRRDRLAPRHGARPGDWLVVTGAVGSGGAAALGLRASRVGSEALNRLLDIRPRVAEGRALVRWAHAMTDTSDGLAAAAHLVSEASGCRLLIEADWIPWDSRLTETPATDRAAVGFYGGDYELFAALPRATVAAARRALRALGTDLTVVGIALRGRGALWRQPGKRPRPLPPAGWDPFHAHPP